MQLAILYFCTLAISLLLLVITIITWTLKNTEIMEFTGDVISKVYTNVHDTILCIYVTVSLYCVM